MALYFAQVASGPIKIGISTHPRHRIASLRRNGERPTLLAVAIVEDDRATEFALHRVGSPGTELEFAL